MPDGAEGPPLAAPDVPVPAPELADDPDAPPLAAAPPAPPPAPPPPPPPCAKTGAAIAKDSAAVRRSVFRFMTFSGCKEDQLGRSDDGSFSLHSLQEFSF